VVHGEEEKPDGAVERVSIEKKFLQGGSIFELIFLPIAIAACIGFFFYSTKEGPLDYASLVIGGVLTLFILLEVPKTYHVIIEVDRDSIRESKRDRTKIIPLDGSVKVGVETARRRVDPTRTIVTGITIFNEKDYVDCDETDGWKSEDIQALWNIMLTAIDEGKAKMAKSMEKYYYSIPDVNNVT
jgi:hypothetical protein